jgi:hypothetical protein
MIVRIVGAVACLFLLAACSGSPRTAIVSEQSLDAASSAFVLGGPGMCAGPATADGGVADGGYDGPSAPDGSVWVTLYGCLVPAPAGPDPPVAPCDDDASAEGGICPPPPSVCADPAWLVYYDNGQCVAGQCVWQKEHTTCHGVGCSAGSCHYLGTSAAAPN